MNKLKQLIQNFKDAPSSIHFLLDHKAIFIAIIAVISFLLRFVISAMQKNIFLQSLSDSLEFASIIAASTIAILIYFKDAINRQISQRISNNNYTAIFGLGKFSTALLDNELEKNSKNYIIFEKDIQNDKIEYFRKMGMGIVQGDALDSKYLEELNFETMEYAVISMGSDRLNIELATMLIDLYKEKSIETPIKLVVHIINKDLNTLFHQKFIAPQMDSKHKIDVKTFSFYEEVAEKFFEQNFIDGEDNSIMKGSDDYHIAVVGDGELALNIIYQAGKIAHLPNENLLHIHLIDKDAEKFERKVIKRYSGINSVLKLHTYNMDDEAIEYYTKDEGSVWNTKNLTHVIICYDDEEHNLNIATDLFNKTYLADAVDDTMKTRVSFALFNAYQMSSKIDEDKSSFKHFYSFGDVKAICTRDGLMDEKDDLLSKLVHFNYADIYTPKASYNLDGIIEIEELKKLKWSDSKNNLTLKDYHYQFNEVCRKFIKVKTAINNKWYDSSRLSDKLSSKAQSKHIVMKLKALGLKYKVSKKSPEELLEQNRNILDKKLEDDRDTLNLGDAFLQKYSEELPKLWDENLKTEHPIDIKYFPQKYATMLEKLTRAEHNRWNAFHYLNGWIFSEVKSKPKKQHDCLKPLANFDEPELQLTVIYDIYSILYMPNYLANAGFQIVEFEGNNNE